MLLSFLSSNRPSRLGLFGNMINLAWNAMFLHLFKLFTWFWPLTVKIYKKNDETFDWIISFLIGSFPADRISYIKQPITKISNSPTNSRKPDGSRRSKLIKVTYHLLTVCSCLWYANLLGVQTLLNTGQRGSTDLMQIFLSTSDV